MAGDYNKNNQLNTISISPGGQTLIGGALYKIPYGRSAVLIEADTIIRVPPQAPSISVSPSSTACTGDTITLTANSLNCDECTYTWNDLLHTVGPILKVTLPGTYQVTASNNAESQTATQVIVMNPAPAKPTITLQGSSLKSSATAGNQWYLNGTIIPGATSQLLTPTVPGTYKVKVTENGCSSLSDDYPFTITAIIDPSGFGGQVQIVPNPVSDRIYTINRLNHTLELTIYDMTGKLIIATRVPLNSTREVFVGHLNKGIYMIIVTDPKTNKGYQKTLMKL